MLCEGDVQEVLWRRRQRQKVRQIAREMEISKNTVKRYVRLGKRPAFKVPERKRQLAGWDEWLHQEIKTHAGNAVVVQQELKNKHKLNVGLRTIQRAVHKWRGEIHAEQVTTVRFETAPGQQLQIDFGERYVWVAGVKRKEFFFVATLGYSRRPYVARFDNEQQEAWFSGLEGAFRHFGGVTATILIDNPRTMVLNHRRGDQEVVFNDTFLAFARYWGFTPRACAPHRARTKGKDESGVKYVKRNAIAGRKFRSEEELDAHLVWWMREVADVRIHGTTGEQPLERFRRDEQAALQPITGRPSFLQTRELTRQVHNDCLVAVDTNGYSVPQELVHSTVQVVVTETEVVICFAGREKTRHLRCYGRYQRIVHPEHWDGLPGAAQALADVFPEVVVFTPASAIIPIPLRTGELQRPLSEYAAAAGGIW